MEPKLALIKGRLRVGGVWPSRDDRTKADAEGVSPSRGEL